MKKISISLFVAFVFVAAACGPDPLKIRTAVSEAGSNDPTPSAGTPPVGTPPSPVSDAPAPTATDTSSATATATSTVITTPTATVTTTATATQSDTAPITVSQTSTQTSTDTISKSGCQVTGQVDLSVDGPKASKKIMPLTSAASDSGSAIAFFDETSEDVAVNLYDLSGKLLSQSRLSYRSTPSGVFSINPSYIKMAGGKDDYVVAVTDVAPSQDNGWLSDYSIFHVSVGVAQIVAQPMGVQSLALVADGNGEFYSVEGSAIKPGSVLGSCNGVLGYYDSRIVRVRPLLSGSAANETINVMDGLGVVDASLVGNKLSILLSGTYSDNCGKKRTGIKVEVRAISTNDGALQFSNPEGLGKWSDIIDGDGTYTIKAMSLFSSSTWSGMFWLKDVSTTPGGYNRSFYISTWKDGNWMEGDVLDIKDTFGQPTYVFDRPGVLGWNDNIVQVAEGWDTDPSQVLLYVSNGSGDGVLMSYKIYEQDAGQYNQSFAGRDRHFVIVDGTDMVRGSYGARATFVTCYDKL